ncbi:peptidase inhibitor family I36 protein [Streptomyces sp. 1331.2]|uniref:peptidase inhibitor family I36 protein n=1 Tax=Streptomyces sp. 1331.2 TaxID=1938835 RepID=UPI000BC72E1C|nr:peptidase inhibitor family I36 protein [Streptomyces sp. 1331.2]SOB88479.1 Peptidase inhibitor family I36 [Streptomyces sp. 1331.2]
MAEGRITVLRRMSRVVVAVGVLLALAPAGHASAADGQRLPDFFWKNGAEAAGPDTCPKGYFCLYADPDFNYTTNEWGGYEKPTGGNMFATRVAVANLGQGMNDRASSLVNNTGRPMRIYEDADYRGHEHRIGTVRSHFRTLRPAPSHTSSERYGPEVGFDWNDKISSVRA